jgi:DNA-directed RNA polymerase beta subunit
MKPSQLQKILDYAFPITEEDRKCNIKLQKVEYKRGELVKMIEAYRQGVEYSSPMLITVDLNEIRKMINN